MVTAMLFAGGVGRRMKSDDLPKQFMEIGGKPIIVRTAEHFQNHPEVDMIVIACKEDWIGHLNALIDEYKLDKVRSVVPGGDTGYQQPDGSERKPEGFGNPALSGGGEGGSFTAAEGGEGLPAGSVPNQPPDSG